LRHDEVVARFGVGVECRAAEEAERGAHRRDGARAFAGQLFGQADHAVDDAFVAARRDLAEREAAGR